MAAMKKYKSVDQYVQSAEHWSEEIKRLREILQSTGLDETLKWSTPCYTHNGANVVGIGGFKSYFGLWFFQGTFLDDPKNVLINCQEGRTRGMRQWRMTSAKEIKPRIIKSYVKAAIELADKGIAIKPDRSKPIVIPPELKKVFDANSKAKEKFKEFTKGKRREFTDYITEAKRPETKLKRIEKILPMILDGVGLNDKYR